MHPSTEDTHPIILSDGSRWPYTYQLKAFLEHPNIEAGDYSYYSVLNAKSLSPSEVASHLAPYLHPMCPENLSIGKFCQIASGAKFITASANHQMSGFSTFPFAMFGKDWAKNYTPEWPSQKGNVDNVVGNDVWIGHDATIMPGVHIGSGAIIATNAVVAKDVAAYSIVGGNPAKEIKLRFPQGTIDELLEIKWWDLPVEIITENLEAIVGNDLQKLREIAAR